jgi:hypothetical protein
MLGMRKTAALLDKQHYGKTIIKLTIKDKIISVQKVASGVAIKIESKIIIKSKIIAVQKITSGVSIKINMCYMLRQEKITCECRVWALHSLLGVLASC